MTIASGGIPAWLALAKAPAKQATANFERQVAEDPNRIGQCMIGMPNEAERSPSRISEAGRQSFAPRKFKWTWTFAIAVRVAGGTATLSSEWGTGMVRAWARMPAPEADRRNHKKIAVMTSAAAGAKIVNPRSSWRFIRRSFLWCFCVGQAFANPAKLNLGNLRA
jgi:hypothetical protein